MGNKIITTSDPTDDTHLARKKYVDDENKNYLNLYSRTIFGKSHKLYRF